MNSTYRNSFIYSPLRALARLGLMLSGWKIEIPGAITPPIVCIGAPHTSNWDFLLMLAAVLELDLDLRWLGKDSLFRFPFGTLMRWLGGIPTNRTRVGNQVSQAANLLISSPTAVLCVAPEGTRSKVKRWRTGFYHIASQAGVPILMAVIDAERRQVRLLGTFDPTGNMGDDIAAIQQYYRGFHGLIPANAFELPEN